MKKSLFLIMLLIAIMETVVPCCGMDDCCADQIANTTEPGKHQDEGICSPFFACATCPVSVELAKPLQLIEPVIQKPVHYETIVTSHLSTYVSSFWQPPRLC